MPFDISSSPPFSRLTKPVSQPTLQRWEIVFSVLTCLRCLCVRGMWGDVDDSWCCSALPTSTAHLSSRGSGARVLQFCALLLTSTTAFGQASTTATIRGTVQDPSGGVLPGATVTAHQHRHERPCRRRSRTTAGSICSPVCFRARYDLKVELAGFKTYEQKGLALSPNDNRGIDVRLEIGSRRRPSPSPSQVEVHPDRNRRARRRAERQADRQPLGHRPKRARAAAHPARRRHRVQPG